VSGTERIPEATELVYVPEPSWLPFFAAAGFTAILLGLFAGLVWAIVGAVVLLVSAIAWIKVVGTEVSRMPRSQAVSSAVIPAIPPRLTRSDAVSNGTRRT
jgi:hypothetical protein